MGRRGGRKNKKTEERSKTPEGRSRGVRDEPPLGDAPWVWQPNMQTAIDGRWERHGGSEHTKVFSNVVTDEMLAETRERFKIPAEAPRETVIAMMMRDTPHSITLPVFNKMRWTFFAAGRPVSVPRYAPYCFPLLCVEPLPSHRRPLLLRIAPSVLAVRRATRHEGGTASRQPLSPPRLCDLSTLRPFFAPSLPPRLAPLPAGGEPHATPLAEATSFPVLCLPAAVGEPHATSGRKPRIP